MQLCGSLGILWHCLSLYIKGMCSVSIISYYFLQQWVTGNIIILWCIYINKMAFYIQFCISPKGRLIGLLIVQYFGSHCNLTQLLSGLRIHLQCRRHRGCGFHLHGSERSLGGGNGNPFQYSCLENPMDREAWQATVHGVTKRHYWVTNTFTFPNKALYVPRDLIASD